MSACEIHFTEGFTGQSVIIEAGDRRIAEPELRTRFQTGLAHIETLDLEEGEKVSFHAEGIEEKSFTAETERPFVVVRLDNGALDIAKSHDRPGYV